MWQIQDSDSDELSKRNFGVWKVDGAAKNHHDTDWICSATGGTAGILLGEANESLSLRVENVGTDILPSAEEQYVCGDAWKIYFPQTTEKFSMRLSVRVVEATATRIVWEPTFSIQTSLLDSAPSLSLTARGEPDDRLVDIESSVSNAVSVFARRAHERGQVIVMLGPNDAPFTKNRCSRTRLDLRIFGEFLEKGVIRKVRPWIVIDRSDAGVSRDALADYSTRLCQAPLPLTA